MLAPAEASASQRVRCRPICRKRPGRARRAFDRRLSPSAIATTWAAGLQRLAALPPIEGMARFGHALENEYGLVGALITISSRRGAQIICNVSGWYVRPSHRAHSTLLVGVATKLKHVIYLNASPAPHTWRTLQATGWKPYNFGRSAAFPVLRLEGGKVHEAIPAALPEYALLQDHRAWGCISLVCEKDGALSPFVFRRRRLARPPLPVMELIYCRATSEFERCGAALGRYFLKRGCPGFLVDGKVGRMPVALCPEQGTALSTRGASAPQLNDLAYTEKVIFG